ncbi:MAG: flagellar hook-basal body complex protein [Verrucomicrobiae bacterium]|nr:flagellar hook-basal body complex protein [Verrucomicrobiae bacterium]
MPRSLFTAVAGLQSHQQRMDVLADNISNANTVGFKGSRMTFIESFNQTMRPPSDNQPVGIQIGLGNQISAVAQQFSQGAFQRTGVITDVAISGEGFMVVQDASGTNYFTRDGAFSIDKDGYLITSLGYSLMGPGATWAARPATGLVADTAATDPGTSAPASVSALRIPNTFVYADTGASGTHAIAGTAWAANTVTVTCAGHGFSDGDSISIYNVVPAGYNTTTPVTITVTGVNTFTYTLDTDPGAYVSGGSATDYRLNTTVSYSIGTDGKITLFGSQGDSLDAGYLTSAKFSNPQGLLRAGNNLFSFNSAAGSQSGGSSFSPTDDVRKAGTNGNGTTQSGALELSNVDMADQFTDMIVTQRGFDANARVITTADEMLQTLNGLKR